MIGFVDKAHGILIGGHVVIYDPVIILKPEMIYLADGVRVDSFCKIEGGLGVRIGKCVHICSFCHVNEGGGEIEIGDYAGLAGHVTILGGSNMPEGLSMSAAAPRDMQVIERTKTIIGPYAFVGAGVVVLWGRTVGEGAVVGSGAVVTHDIPPWEIWAGVPARKIGERQR